MVPEKYSSSQLAEDINRKATVQMYFVHTLGLYAE